MLVLGPRTLEFWLFLGQDLIVDVVAPLSELLKYHSGFFQEVYEKKSTQMDIFCHASYQILRPTFQDW